MQPMLFVTSAIRGLFYLNGRLIGDMAPDRPLCLPASPGGALYVEFKPLEDGYLAMARCLVLAGGNLVHGSLRGQSGVCAVEWPGGLIEIELMPEPLPSAPAFIELTEGDFRFKLIAAPRPVLEVYQSGRLCQSTPLPPLSDRAHLGHAGGELRLYAECASGEQLLAIFEENGGSLQMTLLTTGREISPLSDGGWRVMRDLEDTVGHALLETFHRTQPSGGSYALSALEHLWSPGRPSWPITAQDTALAALTALNMGLTGEAEQYFVPALASRIPELAEQTQAFDGCIPLKYPLSDGQSAVGLKRLMGEKCVRVLPVRYHAVLLGGAQGPWRLDELTLPDAVSARQYVV